MTYETALNWAIDHIDMNEYDDFNSWYDDVQDSLQTPSLDNPEFEKMAEDAWDREIGIEEMFRIKASHTTFSLKRKRVVTYRGCHVLDSSSYK